MSSAVACLPHPDVTDGGEIYFVDWRNEPISTHAIPRPISIDNVVASMRSRFSNIDVPAGTSRPVQLSGTRVDWSLVELA